MFRRADVERALRRAIANTPVMKFNCGDVGEDDPAVDERVVAVNMPPPDDDVAGHFANASNCIWGDPTLRANQLRATKKICYDLECEGKLLVVACTRSGKSQIVRLVGSVFQT